MPRRNNNKIKFDGAKLRDEIARAESYKELDEKIKTHYRNIFAERLKEARRKAELTQAELSKSLGLTKNAVSNYEQAIREPSLATLVRLSQKLKKPVGWFFGSSRRVK